MRVMLAVLIFVAGCTHRIEFKPENSEQTKVEKILSKAERLAVDLEAQQATERRRVEIKPGGCGFIHITRDDPAPAQQPPQHPKDLPASESTAFDTAKALGLQKPFKFGGLIYSERSRIDPELELKIQYTYDRLFKHINEMVDVKLEIIRHRDELRELKFDNAMLKKLVGEVLAEKKKASQ